jgi:hypothetical protein
MTRERSSPARSIKDMVDEVMLRSNADA